MWHSFLGNPKLCHRRTYLGVDEASGWQISWWKTFRWECVWGLAAHLLSNITNTCSFWLECVKLSSPNLVIQTFYRPQAFRPFVCLHLEVSNAQQMAKRTLSKCRWRDEPWSKIFLHALEWKMLMFGLLTWNGNCTATCLLCLIVCKIACSVQ